MQATSRQPYHFTLRKNDLEVWSRFPLSWYERTFLYTGVGISIGLMLQLFFWRSWGFLPPSWLSSLAAICYVVGFLFNFVSTHLPMRLKSAFDDRELRMNSSCEGNLLLAAYPTWAQQIWNVSTLFSLLFIPLVAIMPGVGFGAFILHGLAGMGNYRVYRRSLLTLNLFDTCERSAAKDDGGGVFQKRMNGSENAPKGKLRGASKNL
jgi:hypothetical protein